MRNQRKTKQFSERFLNNVILFFGIYGSFRPHELVGHMQMKRPQDPYKT